MKHFCNHCNPTFKVSRYKANSNMIWESLLQSPKLTLEHYLDSSLYSPRNSNKEQRHKTCTEEVAVSFWIWFLLYPLAREVLILRPTLALLWATAFLSSIAHAWHSSKVSYNGCEVLDRVTSQSKSTLHHLLWTICRNWLLLACSTTGVLFIAFIHFLGGNISQLLQ